MNDCQRLQWAGQQVRVDRGLSAWWSVGLLLAAAALLAGALHG